MSLLEEKIKKNRDSLDAAEPSQGHLERFERKLERLHQETSTVGMLRRSRTWKVAAVILILAVLSVTLYLVSPGRFSNNLVATPLPQEIQEAKMYYQMETQKKLNQVEQCANSPNQAELIRQIAKQELQQLDSNSAVLEAQLTTDQDNKRVKDALILNYKTKVDLIEDIMKKVCKL